MFGLVLASVLASLTIGVFVFVPEQATETVREVIQAAQSFMKKEEPPADATKNEDAAKPAHSLRRTLRSHNSTAGIPSASTGSAEPAPAPRPAAPKDRLLHKGDLPPGTARAAVRELLGEPDLVLSKIEKGHVVEHYVYVNRSLNSATSIMLMDGRVFSVSIGVPSVGVNETATKLTPASPGNFNPQVRTGQNPVTQ
jgi:hypothetical protein